MHQPSFPLKNWHNAVSVTVILLIATILAIVAALSFSQPSSALSGKDFKPGNIIDDYTFYNKSSMSASQIQTFLNAKVPSCDTNGTKPASDWGRPDISHATLASYIRNGTNGYRKDSGFHAPPYTCLRDYKQNTPQMEAASGLCGGISAKTNRTAAQIIKDVADACGINPQVLIVLLEKEQSLVTDTWPLKRQFQYATGFDCPDTAPCDPQFAGFFYQVYHAARQFKIYKANPMEYNYIAGRTNNIYWHPDLSRCGSSQVYIENQATAALYIYTPYRPNQAALNNLYGEGDSCSSYGNRNFWSMFTNWFGGTHGGITVSGISFESQPFTGAQTYAKLTIKNVSKTTYNLGRIKIEARGTAGSYYQTPSVSDITVKPGATYTFKQPITITEEGNVTFAVARNVNNTWMSPPFSDFTINSNTNKTVPVTAKPTIDQSLSLPSGNQHVNSPVTATFRVKNNSTTQAVNVGRLKVQGELNGKQYDFTSTENNLTIPAGQTYTYNKQFNPTKTGTYNFKIMNDRSEYGWSTSFPASSTSSINRAGSITVKDAVTLTKPLTISKTIAHQNENIMATFTVKNFSTKPVNIGRMKVQGNMGSIQHDFPSTPDDLTLQPGQEYNYSKTTKLTKNGTYNFKIMNLRDGIGWSSSYPMNESDSLTRSANVSVKDPVTVTAPLVLSTTSTRNGNTISATFTMKNFSTKPVNIGRMKVEGHVNGKQYDFPSTPDNLTLQPGQEYVYNKSRDLPDVGKYTFELMNVRDNIGWSNKYPISETSGLTRSASVTALDAVTVTSGLSLSASNALTSDTITATFTMKNFSTKSVNIGRMKVESRVNGLQYDFPSTPNNLTLQPGQEYIYSGARKLPVVGTYNVMLANYRSWVGWSLEYPVAEASNISRTTTIVIE